MTVTDPVAERIRQRIRHSFEQHAIDDRYVEVGLSGGIASYPVDGEDPPSLIARADQALYLAKRQGKNRISLFHSERRQSIRYPAKLAAVASLREPSGAETGQARPLNLSRGGALLDLDHEPRPAAAVELSFAGRDAAGRPRNWVHAGRVVRVEPRGTTGERWRVAVAFDRELSDECLFEQVQRTGALRAVQGGRR